MTTWLRLAVTVPASAVEAVSEALLDAGASGIAEEYPELTRPGPALSGDPGAWSPPPPPPAAGVVTLAGYLPREVGTSAALPALQRRLEDLSRVHPALAGARPVLEQVPDEDWGRAWREHYAPVDVGRRLRVRPSWVPPREGRLEIAIDPGMAFGTGTHGTTAGCLEALERALEHRPGAAVLDVGCGTGILAIGAVLLGAGTVTAVEIDPDAVAVARACLALNGVSHRVDLRRGSVEAAPGRHDVVLANLLAPVLVRLAGDLAGATAPGGLLIASGLLREQEGEVVAALERAGLALRRRADHDEWVVLELAAPPDAPPGPDATGA